MIGVITVVILALLIAGLAYQFFNRRVSIGSINQDPLTFQGKVVTVSGQVKGRLAIGSFSLYYLEDDTGKIRVRVPNGSLPQVGEKVTVRGTVNSPLKVGRYALGTTIDEQQRW
ncbi:MAG: TOBE domain-containing protein [Abditibacteriales bacterium]|nr:TOBE domain-containing protein [Abditibacteriales bacterium]